jgi:hypothetical protein
MRIRRKHVFLFFLAVALVVVVVQIVSSATRVTVPNRQTGGQASGTTTASVPPLTLHAPPQVPAPAKAGSGQKKSKHVTATKDSQNVLAIAVLVEANLSSGRFQPKRQLTKLADKLVLPQLRAPVVDQLVADATWFNQNELHYPNLRDAAYRSNYFVQVLQWRMVRMSSEAATISLYTKMQCQTAEGQSIIDYGITFINLEKLDGKWLYAGASDPPANQEPPDQPVTAIQEQEAFAPYLRKWGYQAYEGTE